MQHSQVRDTWLTFGEEMCEAENSFPAGSAMSNVARSKLSRTPMSAMAANVGLGCCVCDVRGRIECEMEQNK